MPPLLERDFRYGPSGSDGKGDCAALVRDWYLMERRIELPEFARENLCWVNQPDLYRDNMLAAGFSRIGGALSSIDLVDGDVLLMAIRSKAPNHTAIYQRPGMILHHLQDRLSRVEPLNQWMQFTTDIFRHE